jgi:glycosyl hydrolase family 65
VDCRSTRPSAISGWISAPDRTRPITGAELDLDTGIATIRYTAGGVHYVREVFASAPASHCLIVRLTADKPGSISFQATMTRPADASTESAPGRLILTGQSLPKACPWREQHRSSILLRSEGHSLWRKDGKRRRPPEHSRCGQRHPDDRRRDRDSRERPGRRLRARSHRRVARL